jgi:AP-2 complex subunit alpha
MTSAGEVDLARNSKVMSGNRYSLLQGIDPNPSNVSISRSEATPTEPWTVLIEQLVVAGVLHMSSVGKV